MTKTSVFCIATSLAQAEKIVDELKKAHFSKDDIAALFSDKQSEKTFAHEKNTKAPEGTVTGLGTGGVLGGALGWIAGIGALAIPGVGPFIAAGPIMAALGGAAIGATVGGIAGGLIGLGIPEFEAKRYEGELKKGNILVSVHAQDSDAVARAKAIFTAAGAGDICTAAEATASTKEPKTKPAESLRGATGKMPVSLNDEHMTAADDKKIQLKEETVTVGKRQVESGGVRLRKVVHTEVVKQPVELKREEIVIERVEGSREVSGESFKDEEIFIPLTKEEAVVQKSAHVREEVHVGKKRETDHKQVTETVRKEELEVEKNVSPKTKSV